MSNGIFKVPFPKNETPREYLPGSKEKKELKSALAALKSQDIQIPLIINGQEVFTANTGKCIIPHEKDHVLAVFHKAGEKEVNDAVIAALNAKKEWERMPWEQRAAVFLKAANLIAGPYRSLLNAATMLGQSKTIHQSEGDAICELADFFRFNAYYMNEIYTDQPNSTTLTWNRTEYRALEGFVFAVTPFNFTAIGGNLPCSPAMMGNVVLWKPSSTSVYSNYIIMKILKEAGLPDGVINFLPGSGSEIGNIVFKNPNLAGVHFTGSTNTFNEIWATIGKNIANYKTYPRIVGETGGKDYIFAHPSADKQAVATAIIRGAFEYQGQKCSAASRAYIPESMYAEIKENLIKTTAKIKMGDPADFTNFMSAVIDEKSFNNIISYIEYAKNSEDAEIIAGGNYDDSKGYFIQPTIIQAFDPMFRTMMEEIFGPVITLYVYEDEKLNETLELCDKNTEYGLTGAIFAQDRTAIIKMFEALYHSAGNFSINDKPTGSVVGQQPFGGARHSGTNDKAGSKLNLYRWISQMTIKENFMPDSDYSYPLMEEE